MKKPREFHNNESENISGQSNRGAALIRGRRLETFLSQMRRLFEGGTYSSKYGKHMDKMQKISVISNELIVSAFIW